MCGRFEQSGTRKYYARALGVDTRGTEWIAATGHADYAK